MTNALREKPAQGGAESPIPGLRYALVVAHPGHELRVLGWVRAVKPLVSILTDGSGHDQSQLRLTLSTHVLRSAGALYSSLFGLMTDREIYRAILDQNHVLFLELAESLATLLVENQIECVVGDAIECYNPIHDVCRLLIDRAVRGASQKTGTAIKNYASAWSTTQHRLMHPQGDCTLVWSLMNW